MNLANPLNATSIDGVDVSSWKLVPFVLSDLQTGVIVVATQPLADLTGYPLDELVGKSVIDLGLWDSLAERTLVLQQQAANTPQRPARLKSADGGGRDVLFGWQLVSAAGRDLVAELIIDVSFVSETRARFERLSRFRGRLTEVLRESLGSGLDDSFYERVLRSAVDTIPGAQAASLSVRDSDGIYRFKAAIGFDLPTLQKVQLKSSPKAPGPGNGPWLYRGYGHNQDLPEETRRLYLAAGPTDKIKVSIVTQVRLEGEPVAFFNLDNLEDPDAFDDEALSMALDYAQHLAVLMQRFRFEEALWHQAHYDKLTGLPNRRLFESMLSEALTTGRATGRRVAVCFIDIDNFKSINDTYGHTFGDQVVAAVTERLSGLLPSGATLSRWGGDELVALLPGISEDAEAGETVGRLIESAAEPYLFTGLSLKCTLSVGVAITPDAGTTGEELLQNADIALYRAKQAGRNTYRIVDDEMRKAAQLQAELPPAVAEGQIGLHYQPRFDMRGRLVAMEALARWNHPEARSAAGQGVHQRCRAHRCDSETGCRSAGVGCQPGQGVAGHGPARAGGVHPEQVAAGHSGCGAAGGGRAAAACAATTPA